MAGFIHNGSDVDHATFLGNIERECLECGGEREHEPTCSAMHDCAKDDGESCVVCTDCYRETGEMYACRAQCPHGKADRGEVA